MSKKRLKLLKRVYPYDHHSKNFMIRVSIKKYIDVFNDLDPAPLWKRDLAQGFVTYLEECSRDIPLHYTITLNIICEEEVKDKTKEDRMRDAISTYCNLYLVTLEREKAGTVRQSLIYIFIFVLLMFTSLILEPQMYISIFTKTLQEGLSIGSWVFLWEALALLFFKSRKTRNEYRIYERLQGINVFFEYDK